MKPHNPLIKQRMRGKPDRLLARIAEDCGANLLEYALLAGLIAVVAILTVSIIGQTVSTQFSHTASQLG